MIMDIDLVIALDIGSTYSGYACQFRDTFMNNKQDIWTNNRWGTQMSTCKTTTCVLLKADGNVLAIGYKAEETFTRECDKDRDNAEKNYYFFKNFKMVLYQEHCAKDNDLPQVEDAFLRKQSILEVMSKFIYGLKNDCLERFCRQRNLTVEERRIRWVITVPAIWNEKAKNIMRKSAEMAGIQGDQLLLALEPEAAAIHCLYLPEQERRGMHDLGSPRDKFLVVDLGGGTVDISAVEVVEGGRLKEIVAANGGPWGGQSINEIFLKHFKKHFKTIDGAPVFDEMKKSQLLKVHAEIEKAKVSMDEDIVKDDVVGEVELNLSHEIRQKLQSKVTPEDSDNEDVFVVRSHGLFFRPKIMLKIMVEEAVQKVTNHLKKIMQKSELQDVKKIVLVGGFSESPFVAPEIRKELNNKQIFVPINPTYAVLKGAVLFGHRPDIIKSRISRFTYGIKVREIFDYSRHDIAKLVKTDDLEFCKDVFSIHVCKGQIISVDDKQPTQVYHPVSVEQKAGSVRIFQSDSESPVYVTDAGCQQIGVLIVPMPDTTGGTSRDIEITMIYGGTEIRIEAMDVTSGKRVQTEIQFTADSL
ncbi:hypothetical protein ACJMK2_012156 [Sinanodonta woodiana]|uniref:Heat shock 70 kDa protein 12A n=1 Tax=Sinanodonta woodiana TaxID=1069815 RepID=A0ABD3VA66_SINWO